MLSDVSIKDASKMIGVMTESSNIPFDFTVEEIAMMGRIPCQDRFQLKNKEDKEIVYQTLKDVGIFSLREHSYNMI
ncbi:hypothetical protein SH2C18_32090 [Clostridium sediminicola]|uniref:hypothetical protein n=1 Tax=Clostridium sediminicola TaxID=3114879 RepID=UPI0031F24325